MNARYGFRLGCAVVLASTGIALAQPATTPNKGDAGILINPTMTECDREWQGDVAAKWSKPQFDQYCASLKSPSAIVANPTTEECAKGWDATLRWSRDQFDNFCKTLQKSK